MAVSERSDRSTKDEYLRKKVARALQSRACDFGIGVIILISLCLVVKETDHIGLDTQCPDWVEVVNFVFLWCYVIELTLKLFAYRFDFFQDGWNVLDFVVVGGDVVLWLLASLLGDVASKLSVVRVCRLVRLTRAFKVATLFPELALLLRGLLSACKAMLWGIILVLMVLVIWSVLAVQFLHPLNKQVALKDGVYVDCLRCPHAFETVFASGLTFFQTVVAGDAWGQVALPIIEEYPSSGLFFMAVIVSVGMAIMNLILAVIVDSAQGAKQDLQADADAEGQYEYEMTTAQFLQLCQDLDVDKDGFLSKEELLRGFDEANMGHTLRAAGLHQRDTDTIFDMAMNNTGNVEYNDFVEQLRRLKYCNVASLVMDVARLRSDIHRFMTSAAKPVAKASVVRAEQPGNDQVHGAGTVSPDSPLSPYGRPEKTDLLQIAKHASVQVATKRIVASGRSPRGSTRSSATHLASLKVLSPSQINGKVPMGDCSESECGSPQKLSVRSRVSVDSRSVGDMDSIALRALQFPRHLRQLADEQENTLQALQSEIDCLREEYFAYCGIPQERTELKPSRKSHADGAKSILHVRIDDLEAPVQHESNGVASGDPVVMCQRSIQSTGMWSTQTVHTDKKTETYALWPSWTDDSHLFKGSPEELQDAHDLEFDDFHEATEEKQSITGACVSNPNGKRRIFWDIGGMCVLSYDLVMIPFQLAFAASETPAIKGMTWFTLVFWTMDIFGSFMVGYYDKRGRLVMDPRKICWHYLQTWFCLDVIIVGLDWLMVVVDGERSTTGLMRVGRLFRALRILRVLRLLRLVKLKQIMAMVQDRMDSEYMTITLSVIKLMVLIVAINHLIACMWFKLGMMQVDYAVSKNDNPTWVRQYGFDNQDLAWQYLSSLHWSLTQFTPASMNVQPTNIHERLFAVLVLLFAMIVFSSFVSSITAAMNQLRNLGAKNGSQLWLLRKYLREQHIPHELYARVVRYASVTAERQQRRVQKKDVLFLAILSGPLKNELNTELFKPTLTVHPFFAKLDSRCAQLLSKLCNACVEPLSLSRGDVLFHLGEEATHMYFLMSGQMRYTQAKCFNNTTRFSSGQFCSEAVLWVPWMHCGKMRALMECDLTSLESAAFRRLALAHPLQIPFLRAYATEFMEHLNALGHAMSDILLDAHLTVGGLW